MFSVWVIALTMERPKVGEVPPATAITLGMVCRICDCHKRKSSLVKCSIHIYPMYPVLTCHLRVNHRNGSAVGVQDQHAPEKANSGAHCSFIRCISIHHILAICFRSPHADPEFYSARTQRSDPTSRVDRLTKPHEQLLHFGHVHIFRVNIDFKLRGIKERRYHPFR